LCDFFNISKQDKQIDVKYLYNDLGRGKSIRSRIIASEELVKSGALNPGILFSTYKVKQPSTSGGVWARVKQVQELENFFASNLKNTENLTNHLDLMVKEFFKNKLLPPFAEFYGEKLQLKEIKPSSSYDLIVAINILSGNYRDLINRNKISNFKLQNLVNVINDRDNNVIKLERNNNSDIKNYELYPNSQFTELQNAVLEASNGIYPIQFFPSEKINKAFLKKQDGFVLLSAIYLISSSFNSDISALQTGLASLVKLGLLNEFKAISNELLIMEYFKKI